MFLFVPLATVSEESSLVHILAALADDTTPPASQTAASQVAALEDKDSILLGGSEPLDEEAIQRDEEETLEMSQRVWTDHNTEMVNTVVEADLG